MFAKMQNVNNQRQANTIDWSYAKKGNRALQELSKMNNQTVDTLKLEWNSLTAEAMLSLKRSNWKSLTHLSLSNNQLMAIGCKFLSRTKLNLTTLKLNGNRIGAAGLLHLHKTKWGELGEILLNGNKLADGSLNHLVRADWNPLNNLILSHNTLTPFQANNLLLSPTQNPTFSIHGNKLKNNEETRLTELMKKKKKK